MWKLLIIAYLHVNDLYVCMKGVCVCLCFMIYHILKLAFSQFLSSFHRRLLRKSFPSGAAHMFLLILHSLICVCFMCQRNKMKSHLPVLSIVSRVPDREVSSFPIRHLIIACNGDCKVFKCIIRTHESVGGPLLLLSEVPYCLYAVLNQYLTKS